jgi:hypothetical protein
MIQADLFAAAPIHYGATATPGLANFRRLSACGVVYRVAGSIADPPEPEGSSRLEFVTCPRCLELSK